MGSAWAGVNQWLADVTLWAQLLSLALFAIDAWWMRNGRVTRRFAEAAAAVFVYVSFFTLVDVDRRHNILPSVDLTAIMAAGWRWPFRLLLVVVFGRLWWALRRP
jgi:hypothetical protein